MDKTDDEILEKLAERGYWDIQSLWDWPSLNLSMLERFDYEGWIEIREVKTAFTIEADGAFVNSRVLPDEWFSPLHKERPWNYYFPKNLEDRQQRKPWQDWLDPGNGSSSPESRKKHAGASSAQNYLMHRHAPVELRVTHKWRIERFAAAKDGTATSLKQRPLIVAVFPGQGHSELDIRAALSGTAYLENGSNVKRALKAPRADGSKICQACFYSHLTILDQVSPGWRQGELSNQVGDLENGVSVGKKRKQRVSKSK